MNGCENLYPVLQSLKHTSSIVALFIVIYKSRIKKILLMWSTSIIHIRIISSNYIVYANEIQNKLFSGWFFITEISEIY